MARVTASQLRARLEADGAVRAAALALREPEAGQQPGDLVALLDVARR